MWYILLKNEQLGPMTEREVVELYTQGVIDLQTLVWREGLAEWASLADTPDFATLSDQDSLSESLADDEDEEDATLIANPADADLQAALAELLGDDPDEVDKPANAPLDSNKTENAADGPLDNEMPRTLTDIDGALLPQTQPISAKTQRSDPEMPAQPETGGVIDDSSGASESVDDPDDSGAEPVDEHSILQIAHPEATNTLDDILNDDGPDVSGTIDVAPGPAQVEEDSTEHGQADERPTIGFPMPSQFLGENRRTEASPTPESSNVLDDVKSASLEEQQTGADSEPDDDDEAADEESIVLLGSIDIASAEDDPSYVFGSVKSDEQGTASSALDSPPGVTNLITKSEGIGEKVPKLTSTDSSPPQSDQLVTDQEESLRKNASKTAVLPEADVSQENSAGPTTSGAPIRGQRTEAQSSGDPIGLVMDARKPKPSRKWPIIIGSILLVAVGLIVFLSMQTKSPPPEKNAPKRFVIKTVQKAPTPSLDAGQAAIKNVVQPAEKPPLDAAVPPDADPPSPVPLPVDKQKGASKKQPSTPSRKPRSKRETSKPPSSKKTTKAQAKTTKVKPTPPSAEKVGGKQQVQVSAVKAKKSVPKNTSGVFGRTKTVRRPLTLNRRQITKVLKKNQKRLKKCVTLEPALKGRLVSVAVQIKRDGRIGRAKVATSIARGTPGGACIEAQVKAYRFPAFRGDQMSITLPLRLR